MRRHLLKNPMESWVRWYFNSRKLLSKHKHKNLHIGYLSSLSNVDVGEYNTFYDHTIIANSSFGNYVYVREGTTISNAKVGSFCSIGPTVRIGLGMHPTDHISTHPAFFSTRKQCQVSFTDKDLFDEVHPIVIGNDVWIGANAIILDKVKIGDGAIIAAGAIVSKDVEPYTIVGGIPAKKIKKRFSDEEIEQLLKLKWWDKDIRWIRANYKLFSMPAEFLSKTGTSVDQNGLESNARQAG